MFNIFSISLLTLSLWFPSSTVSAPLARRAGSPQMAIPINFADAAIIEAGDAWYAYSTTNIPGGGGPGEFVPVAVSRDFNAWVPLPGSNVLPSVGTWAFKQEPQVWSPDVIQVADNSFVLYYAARPASNPRVHCIGAATSTNPLGPFSPLPSVLACPDSAGGAIDPDAFRDADGTLYLSYKVDGSALAPGGPCGNGDPATRLPTPIMLQQLSPDGLSAVGPPQVLIDRDPDGGDGPLIEAPSLLRAGNTYFLFFSSGCFNTLGYDASYATAPSIRGPWTKAHSPAQNAPLLTTSMMPHLPPAGLAAPGGLDARMSSDGTIRVVFHGSDNSQALPGVRSMFAGTLKAEGNSVSFV